MGNNKNTGYAECFISNGEVYPLCKGKGEEKCHDCCQYEDYELYHNPHPEECMVVMQVPEQCEESER